MDGGGGEATLLPDSRIRFLRRSLFGRAPAKAGFIILGTSECFFSDQGVFLSYLCPVGGPTQHARSMPAVSPRDLSTPGKALLTPPREILSPKWILANTSSWCVWKSRGLWHSLPYPTRWGGGEQRARGQPSWPPHCLSPLYFRSLAASTGLYGFPSIIRLKP